MCFRFAVGMYWITVAAMGPNARYKLVCSQRMRRPVFSTVHDKVALSSCSVREGVRQRVARAFGLAACSRPGPTILDPPRAQLASALGASQWCPLPSGGGPIFPGGGGRFPPLHIGAPCVLIHLGLLGGAMDEPQPV